MAPPWNSRLPLDAYGLIIDHLCENQKALCACSLVCQDWVPKCRSYIFSDISIRVYRGYETRKLSRFLSTIRSPRRPGSYVRSLTLDMHRNGIEGVLALPILAEYLTDVQTLTIEAMDWDKLNDAGRIAILSGFETVRSLSLVATLIRTFTRTTELISSFPSLNSLGCSDFNTLHSDPEDRPSTPPGLPALLEFPPPPSLRSLVLDAAQLTRYIILWLISATECRVSDVNITLTTIEDFEQGVELFRRLGPELHDLTLNVYADDPLEITVDLSQNTSLSTFCINCEEVSDEYLNFIPDALSQIRSSQLQKLYLEMPVEDEHLESHIWGDIEQVLAHSRFTDLQSLTIEIDSRLVDNNDIRDLFKQKMPKLVARGIIDFLQVFGGGLVPF